MTSCVSKTAILLEPKFSKGFFFQKFPSVHSKSKSYTPAIIYQYCQNNEK